MYRQNRSIRRGYRLSLPALLEFSLRTNVLTASSRLTGRRTGPAGTDLLDAGALAPAALVEELCGQAE